MIAKNNWRCSQ